MESIESTNLARTAPSSLITDLELKIHLDSDISHKFVYKTVTLEEDELFYETSPGSFIAGYDATTKVVALTKTTVDTKPSKEQISTKKDDPKKMSKDDPVEHLQNQTLHHHTLSEQRNMPRSSSTKLKPRGL